MVLNSAPEREAYQPGFREILMKKTLLLIVVILAIALVALPFFGAYKTEEAFNGWIAEVNQAGTYELEWERYEKGWLSTNAVLKVGFKQPELTALFAASGEEFAIPLNVVLHHGPVLWRDGAGLGWFSGQIFLDKEQEIWIQNNLQVDGEEPFYLMRIFMNLAGNSSFNDRSLPFSISTADDTTIQVTAYAGEGKISRNGRLQYTGNLPQLSVVDESGKIAVDDMRIKIDSDFGKKVGRYVLPSSGEFSVSSISYNNEEGTGFSLQKLAAFSDMQINEEQTMANMVIKIGFGHVNFLGESVSDAALQFRFSNVGVEFLEHYLALIQQGYDSGENSAQLAMQSASLATTHLIPFGPELKIDALKFTTAEGKLNFAGRVAVAPEASQALSPFEILAYLSVDSSLLVDKPLAFRLMRQSTLRDLNAAQFEGGEQLTDDEKQAQADNQAQMTLDMLTVQGMLIDKGEQYSSEFHFKDGKAELNGQPVPLPF